ncbi:hypothetical protein N9O57_01530 [bacterium]|nr:hypothetical protein [bacterium]
MFFLLSIPFMSFSQKNPFKKIKNTISNYKELVLGNSSKTSEIHASNNGIDSHFNELIEKNSCFKDLLNTFLLSVKDLDRQVTKTKSQLNNGRPSQVDFAGQGDYKNLSPGFLWKLAMNVANQNPNLAIRFIAACGNDDNHDHGQMKVNCPNIGSVMYLSKALGENVDIKQSLREKIVKLQAPTKGGAFIPSKNYHIIGSIFLNCSLMEDGVSSGMAKKIENLTVVGYRNLKMQDRLKESLKSYKSYEASYEKEKKDELSSFTKEQLKDFSNYIQARGQDGERVALDRDAALVYDNLTMSLPGGISTHVTTPFSSLFLNKSPKMLYRNRPSPLKDVSFDRYKKALDKAKTWLVDIEWTKSQHSVGADFAKKHCRRGIVDKSFQKECLDALSCIKEGKKTALKSFLDDSDKILEEWAKQDDENSEAQEKSINTKVDELNKEFQSKFGVSPHRQALLPSGFYSRVKDVPNISKIKEVHDKMMKVLGTIEQYKKKYPNVKFVLKAGRLSPQMNVEQIHALNNKALEKEKKQKILRDSLLTKFKEKYKEDFVAPLGMLHEKITLEDMKELNDDEI